jgi:hypothetical protein
MNTTGFIAVILFVIGWMGGIAAWFYTAYHAVKSRSRAGDLNSRDRHARKALMGAVAFLGCGLFVAANGLVGGWFGGW